jgi:hypothetical protein
MKHCCQQENPYSLRFLQESTSTLWCVMDQLSSTSHSLRNSLSKIKGEKPSGVPLLRHCLVGLALIGNLLKREIAFPLIFPYPFYVTARNP